MGVCASRWNQATIGNVPPTSECAAQRRSTLRKEVFLKSHLREEVQRNLIWDVMLHVPFYAIPYSGEIHTLNYVCSFKQLPCYHMEMQKMIQTTQDRFKATCFQNKPKSLLNKKYSKWITANFSRPYNLRCELGLGTFKDKPKSGLQQALVSSDGARPALSSAQLLGSWLRLLQSFFRGLWKPQVLSELLCASASVCYKRQKIKYPRTQKEWSCPEKADKMSCGHEFFPFSLWNWNEKSQNYSVRIFHLLPNVVFYRYTISLSSTYCWVKLKWLWQRAATSSPMADWSHLQLYQSTPSDSI